MKFLVQVEADPAVPAPPPEMGQRLVQGHLEATKAWAANPRIEATYTLGRNEGFAIGDFASAEEAWETVNQSPLAGWWRIQIRPLFDNTAFAQDGLKRLEALMAAPS